MFHIRLAILLAVVLGGSMCVSAVQAHDSDPAARTEPEPGRPAVLIVPVWDEPQQRRPSRWVEVIEPGGRIPPSVADRIRPANDGAPQASRPAVGPDYKLLHSFVPNPLLPHLRYYVYLNLSDPSAVRNWRELQRAQRKELRAARAEHLGWRDWERRKQRLLDAHEQAVREGVAALRVGHYRSAIIALTRAAALNHGDPGCRIHLALARAAVGHDTEAGVALRAALELQPKLGPMDLGLEDCFVTPEEFDTVVDTLAQRLTDKASVTAEEHLLLGFLEFQRGRLDEAHAAFQRAAPDMPRNEALQTYLTITKPAAR